MMDVEKDSGVVVEIAATNQPTTTASSTDTNTNSITNSNATESSSPNENENEIQQPATTTSTTTTISTLIIETTSSNNNISLNNSLNVTIPSTDTTASSSSLSSLVENQTQTQTQNQTQNQNQNQNQTENQNQNHLESSKLELRTSQETNIVSENKEKETEKEKDCKNTTSELEIQDLVKHSAELMRKSDQLTQEYIEHIEQLSGENHNINKSNEKDVTSNSNSNLDTILADNHPLANDSAPPTPNTTNTSDSQVEQVATASTSITAAASPASPTLPTRLHCKMHRTSYLMTQMGGLQSSSSTVDELLNEKNPDSGMGYREPGPQGFLSYVDLDPNQPLPTLANNGASQNNVSHQPVQQNSNGSLSGYLHSSNSEANLSKMAGRPSQTNLLGLSSRSVSVLKGEDGKRKSLRQNRMAKNEDDRRKRKEQKRARAKEKPIYVGSLEELPPDCVKMIKKSKIPEDKLRENFEVLLPILRFRTGFNLKSSNPLSKSQHLSSSSNNITAATTTTTTTSSQQPISPETTTAGGGSGSVRHRSDSRAGNASSRVETQNGGINEDDSCYDDGSRLEQSIIPKGTTDLFEKGDVKKLYKNLKQIGSGGFGSVYLAKSVVDKCEIAIKKIAHSTPKAQRTNLNEIGYLHFCNHSNVVRYLRSHLVDDQVWIAMEYMQGGTLTEACSNHSFNESCIAYVAKGMLEGLKYLHSNNLVHRDIKSGNIMMTIEGKIKIVDFGLCVDSTERKLTHMAGSPFWMSPEMIRGEGYGCPSDLWSFGICLLELANGEPPNRKSSLNAMFSIATHAVNGHTGLDRPERWSDNFRHFLTLCLEVDPFKRQTADQLLTHPWLSISENPETMKKILAQIFIANVMNHLDPI